MATLQKTFKYQGDVKDTSIDILNLEFAIPHFGYNYQPDGEGGYFEDERYIKEFKKLSLQKNIYDSKYVFKISPKDLIGEDSETIYHFFRYHMVGPQFGEVDRYASIINLNITNEAKDIIFEKKFEFLFAEKTKPSVPPVDYREENRLFSIYANYENTKELLEDRGKKIFLMNKEVFDSIFNRIRGEVSSNKFWFNSLLEIIQGLVDLSSTTPKLLSKISDFRMHWLRSFLNTLELDVNKENRIIDIVKADFNSLFDFPILIPEVKLADIRGTFSIETDDQETTNFDYYDLIIEYTTRGDNVVSKVFDWKKAKKTSDGRKVKFAFEEPIMTSNVEGMIKIRVRGYDGAILWSEEYLPLDRKLQRLDVSIQKYSPDDTNLNTANVTQNTKRLRGKVVQMGNAYDLNKLTVVVQAKKNIGDSAWMIVGATTTDKSGNFFMNYPYGEYSQAQVVVSLMPESPVSMEIVKKSSKNETISDDFIYILINNDIAVQEEKDKDCECGTPNKAKRLPDQSDLIESEEYTQDMGGACLNLSTPNRTLREYNFHAIVRTSDPEVASYTLERIEAEENGNTKISFNLKGGGETLERDFIGIDNPIRWQDAPKADSDLSFYQAVTVATGHILHYKTVYKADGYSLGDLVYSLPLAPGQKKQIVVFESSHSLQGAESQILSQSEELAAELISDRFVTDQLSGGINESISGRSSATTAGVSGGLGLGGSFGAIGGSLGVAGGYSRSRSSASQTGSRNISQFFDERLRQTLMQNAESYRQLNASVVTTVTEGQQYGVTTEVISNHNHCHSLTMMYFEVLRHYAIYQELASVEECVFVPLIMTNFTAENISKWKDVLAQNLLPVVSNTYLSPRSYFRRRRGHPLLKGFDAIERIKTDYKRVEFPEDTYADEQLTEISGYIDFRINIPRPKTRFDRILSFPIIRTGGDVNVGETIRNSIKDSIIGSVAPCAAKGPSVKRNDVVITKGEIFDMYMTLDANFAVVPPAQSIRVNFESVEEPFYLTIDGVETPMDFFMGMRKEKKLWTAYAKILDMNLRELFQYFNGNLIADWDQIFNEHIADLLVESLIDQTKIRFEPFGTFDLTKTKKYRGGERVIRFNISPNILTSLTRKQIEQINIVYDSIFASSEEFFDFTTINVERFRLNYATKFSNDVLISRYLGNDLLDGVYDIQTPLNNREKRNPKKEDIYVSEQLIEHLNSNLEHYNKVLWKNLDPDRRYMLLDGFKIPTYDSNGKENPPRSLASVIKNELISIAGNSLVFPVSDGYRVGRDFILQEIGDNVVQEIPLLDHYKPLTPSQPYRVSVPTRGVFMEAVQGSCDACEMVKENSSQDWDKFRTDEPTSIAQVVTPTPTVTNYQPNYRDFAQPLVNIQNAPDAPAPAAGLAGLSDALTRPGTFNDITGLAGNQRNVIETFKANTQAAQKYAEMAKDIAMQKHNTDNSDDFMRQAERAKENGAITDEQYNDLVRDHLQQQINGGESTREQAQTERENQRPSLTEAAIEAVNQGQAVQAERTDTDGNTESVNISEREGGTNVFAEVQPPIIPMRQPSSMSCWATTATMMMNWKNNRRFTEEQTLTEIGNNLIPPDESFYVDIFDRDVGLLSSQKEEFINAMHMEGEEPANYPASSYVDWIRNYGPLWITTDASSDSAFSPHARVLFKIEGTDIDDPDRVYFSFYNPENSLMEPERETFREFINQFEQMVTDNPANLFIQIVHFRDRIQVGEGQQIPSNNHWNIPIDLVLDYAIQVGNDEFDTWWSNSLVENNIQGKLKVKEYWYPFQTLSGAENYTNNGIAWSAAFISYLFLRGYLHAVVNNFPDSATYNGYHLSEYDSLNDHTKRTLLKHAKNCLENLGIFKAAGNHIRYITQTMQIQNNTFTLFDPNIESLQVGDFVLNGREGDSYSIDSNGNLTPTSGFSHVDIVMEIIEIEGVNFVRLVGGNTLHQSNKVGYKLRPLKDSGKLVLADDLNDISLQNMPQDLRNKLTRIGQTNYYSIDPNTPGIIRGANNYEKVIISQVSIIGRYI